MTGPIDNNLIRRIPIGVERDSNTDPHLSICNIDECIVIFCEWNARRWKWGNRQRFDSKIGFFLFRVFPYIPDSINQSIRHKKRAVWNSSNSRTGDINYARINKYIPGKNRYSGRIRNITLDKNFNNVTGFGLIIGRDCDGQYITMIIQIVLCYIPIFSFRFCKRQCIRFAPIMGGDFVYRNSLCN